MSEEIRIGNLVVGKTTPAPASWKSSIYDESQTIQKWPNNIVVMRHGQSQRNFDRDQAREQGNFTDFSRGIRDQDTPLTELGKQQSQATGAYLKTLFPIESSIMRRPFDVAYVSPYLRTRETMEHVITGLGYTPHHIVHDERVREIDFGILDGLDRDSILSKYPDEIARKEREGKYFYRAPGGENRPDVKLRLRSLLDTIVRDCKGMNVLIVCHSVVVLSFRSLLERWGEDDYLQVDKENDVLNASTTHYRYNTREGRLKLDSYNSIHY